MNASPPTVDQQLAQMREELASWQNPSLHLGNPYEGRKEQRIATLRHRINQIEALQLRHSRGPITIT